MLKIENFSIKNIDNEYLLKPFNQEIYKDDIVAIKGSSGSGKSTLLKAIVRLIANIDGNIRYNNKTIKDILHWRKKAIYQAQFPIIGTEIVKEYFNIPFKLHSRKTKEIDYSLINQYLTKVKLSNQILEKESNVLSGGEKSRLAFIRLLILKPCVLLLDEFTSALDPQSKIDVENLLLEYHKQNKHVITIFISHDEEQIKRIANRVFIIENKILKEIK